VRAWRDGGLAAPRSAAPPDDSGSPVFRSRFTLALPLSLLLLTMAFRQSSLVDPAPPRPPG
jgi:hypothetical protein